MIMFISVKKANLQLFENQQTHFNDKKVYHSQMSLWYLQFSQKSNKKKSTLLLGTSSPIVFVRFLGELKTPKRLLEINRSLRATSNLHVFQFCFK